MGTLFIVLCIAVPLIIMVAVPASIFLRVATTPFTGSYTRLNLPTDSFVKTVVPDRGITPSVVVAGDRRLAGNTVLLLPGVPVMTTQFPDFVLPFTASETRPILLAWLASRFGGWSVTLWAMLAFAAAGALCGRAIGRIEQRKA